MSRPNIILYMPETIRADAVYGPPEMRAKTPVLDALRRESATFTQCYAPMSYCSPSRCTMFTGLYPHTAGHRSLMSLIRGDEHNFFRDLKDAGYINVAYGKNDLLSQEAIPLCFDEVERRVPPVSRGECPHHGPGSKHELSFYLGERTGDCRDGDWSCIESALNFLDEDHEQPFCVYLPLSFAHPPYVAEEPWFSLHDRAAMPEPIPPREGPDRAFMKALYKGHGMDRLDESDRREIKALYYGMISRVDMQLGLLIDKLKERGLYENTIIVYFSDHGDYAGDYGMVEKFMAGFEDCLLNVPLVIRAPRLPAGRSADALCELTDLYPTLMELLGLRPKHYHFGRSLLPLGRGETDEHRQEVFAEGGRHADETQFLPPIPDGSPYCYMRDAIDSVAPAARKAAMIRTKQWKYVYAPEDTDELYDLQADPDTRHNLIENPDYDTKRDELRERLLRWFLHTGDTLSLDPDPRGWKG